MAEATVTSMAAKFRYTDGVTPTGDSKYLTSSYPKLDMSESRATIINGIQAVKEVVKHITAKSLVNPLLIETSTITAA